MSKQVTIYQPEEHNVVVQKNAAIIELRDNMFRVGIHYGEPFKGAGKPTLLKPGAETIMSRFQLWPDFIERSTVEDWNTEHPIFHYRYECRLIHRETGEVWGAGIGSCNSMEDKYGWRWVSEVDVPPNVDKTTLQIRSSTINEFVFAVDEGKTSGDYGKPEEYWRKFHSAIESGDARAVKRKARTGKEYDAWEIGGDEYRIPNNNVFTIVNTIDKMAQKRAFVAAVLVATGASAYFTQDVEDFPGYAGQIVEGDYTVTVDEHGEVEKSQPATEQSPAPEPSELDKHLNGAEPDNRARDLAIETFPFELSDKHIMWQDFIAITPNWSVAFWVAVKALKLSNEDAHTALETPTMNEYDAGTTARAWLTLCEYAIATKDSAQNTENE